MTIQDTTRKAGPFAGNGVTTTFPFTFKVFTKSDIAVTLTDTNGTVRLLVLDSDYSVVLSSNQETSPGGNISYPITGSPMATGASMIAIGDLPYTQPTDITNSGGFYPSVIEDMSDRSTIQIQQLAELATRTLHFPVTEDNIAGEFPAVGERADTVFGFDANGNPTYLPLPAAIGAGDMRDDVFVAGVGFTPGTTTVFALSRAPGSTANTFAWWDDVPQFNFTLVGNIATFGAAPPADITKVRFRSGTTLSLNTPALGSVSDESLTPGSNIFALNNYHWRVRTDPNNNYDGVNQSGFPEASPLVYAADGESFGWSMRNSKHTAFEMYQAVNGVGTQFYDGVQSVTVLAAGSTIGQATGVAGYIRNICANAGGHPNAVALFGLGTAEVDNSDTWGVNTLLQDAPTRAFGSGLGRLLLGYENDINVMNPDTQVIGVSVGGNSLANPKASNAFIANALGGPAVWGTSFWSTDGNSLRSLVTGRNGPAVPNAASQEMWWMYGDSAGAQQIGILSFQPAGGAAPGGAWTFTGTAKSSMALANGDFNAVSGVYRVASAQVVGAQIPGYGTPLNGTRQSGFNASTATLPQTAAMLAALMVDLKQHGLIGV